jgi:hypothetical protein
VNEFGVSVAHLAWWVHIPSWQWRLVPAGYHVMTPLSMPGVSSLADQPNGSDVPSHHARAILQNPTTQTTSAYPPNPTLQTSTSQILLLATQSPPSRNPTASISPQSTQSPRSGDPTAQMTSPSPFPRPPTGPEPRSH